MKPKNSPGNPLFLAAMTLAAFTLTITPGHAVSGTWDGGGTSGIWGGLNNWNPDNTIADGAGFTATFGSAFTNGYSVTVNTARTIGNITFNYASAASDLILEKHTSNFILTLNNNGNSPVVTVSQSARTLTINPIIAGTAGLTKSGPGKLILTNAASTLSGAITLSAGTLEIGGAGRLGNGSSYAGNLSLASGTTFHCNSTGNTTLGGILSGAGTLAKANSGALTLTQTNTYTTATAITGGTLALAGTGSINASADITLNGGGAKFLHSGSVAVTPVVTVTQGTLTGSGTVGTVNVGAASGGILSNNDGVPGAALTIGALTFNGAATVNTFSNSTAAAAIVATSLATHSSGTVTINPTAPSWTSGSTYDLIRYAGGSIGGAGFPQLVLGTVTGLSARQNPPVLGNSGTAVTLTVTGDAPYWVGDADTKWNLTAVNNWRLLSNHSYATFLATDDVIFNDNASATSPVSVEIDVANVAPMTTSFNNSTKDFALSSSGGFGIASGSLTKNGTGNVTIGSVNTYAGPTTLNAGTLTMSGNGTLGTASAITLGGGKWDLGTTSQTAGAVFVTAPAASGDTIHNGSLTGSSFAASNPSGNAILSADLFGTAGFTKTGAGTATLTGANTYNGATTVTAGTLTLGAAGSMTTAGNILLSVSGATAVVNLDGSYTSTGGGGVALNAGGILNTSGSVAIGGANNQAILMGTALGSGTWNVTGGSVAVNYVGNGWGIGNGGDGTLNVSAGTVTTAGTNTFQVGFLAGGTGTLTISGTGLVTISPGTGSFNIGRVLNAAGVVNLDGGTLAMGRNFARFGTATGTLNFNGGLLQAGLSSTTYLTGLTAANVRNGGAKIDTNSFNITIGQALLHSATGGDNAMDGGLAKGGSGTLTLGGANTYTGPTLVSDGTLQLNGPAAGTLTTSSLTVGGSGTLGFTAGTASTLNLTGKPLSLGGTIAFDLGATGVNDALVVNDFALTANSAFTFNPVGGITTGASYTLLTSANPISTGGFSISGQTSGKLTFTPTINSHTITLTAALQEGTWNQSGGGNWSIGIPDASGGNWTSYKPTVAGDAALFGSTITAPATITVDTPHSVGYVRFDSLMAYTIGSAASGNLTLDNGTSPALVVVNSGSHFIAENVALAGNTLMAPAAGTTLTVSGALSGAGGVQLSDAGTLALSGTNTHAGATTVNGGTLNLTGSLTGGGAIGVHGNGILAESTTGIISGATTLTHTSTATSTLAGANTFTGVITVSSGQLNLSNWGATTLGTVTVATGAVLEFSGSATYNIATRMSVGATSATTGTVNQTGGTVSFSALDCLLVGTGTGTNATGIYNLSGGTVSTTFTTTTRGVMIGVNDGTSGTFNLSGTGNLSLPNSVLMVGRSDSAAVGCTANFNQTGGTATVNALTVGGIVAGTTTATMTLMAGTFVANTFTKLATASNDVTAIHIGSTAVVTLPAFPTARGAGATATLTFDGGTLKPKAASTTYLGGLTNAFIKAGGAKFDTGFDITIAQPLLADPVSTGGGLTKIGANTLLLSGANTYTGGTTIQAGRIQVSTADSLSTGAITITGDSSAGGQLFVSGTPTISNNLNISGLGYLEAPATANRAGALRPSTGQTFNGSITLTGDSRIGFIAGGSSVTLAGRITGGKALDFYGGFSANAATHTFILANIGTANDYTGDTSITAVDYSLARTSGKAVLTLGAGDQLPNGVGKGNLVFNGTDADHQTILELNGFNETINGVSAVAAAGAVIRNSATGSSTLTIGDADATSTFAGAIADGGAGMTLAMTKIGTGTLTLTGINSYTGATTVNGGTLALVGGSQASPITVTGGASLGFTLDAGTTPTSTATVTFNAGSTVKITGTPTLASYTLMTASSFAGVAPALSAPISGYQLQVVGNELKLVKVAGGFASWITGTFANGSVPSDKRGPNDDPDRDGIGNLMEYALAGQDPTVGNASISTLSAHTLSFTKRAATSGLTYAIVESTDLALTDDWTEVTGGTYVNGPTTISYTLTPGSPVKNFARLRVVAVIP